MKNDLAKDIMMTEVDMWAEIYRLREAVQGPDGYETWQDAATAERIRRIKAEKELKDFKAEVQKYHNKLVDIVLQSKW